MLRSVAIVALAACAHAPHMPEQGVQTPPSQRATSAAEVVCPLPDASTVPTGGAWGIVCNPNRQPLAGVTVSVAGAAVITDDKGLFHVPVAAGAYEVAFYWGNCTVTAKIRVVDGPTSPLQERIDVTHC